MVSTRELKRNGFISLEEYFESIMDSKIEGKDQYAKLQYSELSDKQRLYFIEYVTENYFCIGDGDSSEYRDFYNYFKDVA